jgi:hypothetical protein
MSYSLNGACRAVSCVRRRNLRLSCRELFLWAQGTNSDVGILFQAASHIVLRTSFWQALSCCPNVTWARFFSQKFSIPFDSSQCKFHFASVVSQGVVASWDYLSCVSRGQKHISVHCSAYIFCWIIISSFFATTHLNKLVAFRYRVRIRNQFTY